MKSLTIHNARKEAGAEDGPHQRLIVGVHVGRPVQHVRALEELAAVQVLRQLALHAQQHAQRALGQEVLPAEPVLVRGGLVVDEDVGEHQMVGSTAAGNVTLPFVDQSFFAWLAVPNQILSQKYL